MDFELTKSQKEIQKAARDFAKGEFDKELALELDRKHEYPEKIWQKAADLGFIRTAQVGERKYWIWRFRDEYGIECFATVECAPDGTACIGYDINYLGLTPEQYMLGDYHNVF